MNNKERIISLSLEVKALEEHAAYLDWQKLKEVMTRGQQIEDMIRKKLALTKQLIQAERQLEAQQAQMQEQQSEEPIDLGEGLMEEEEQMAPPAPQPQMRQRKVAVPQPERVAVKPQQRQQQAKPEPQPVQQKRTFDYNPDELGIEEMPTIEGLPDDDEE